jgi:D-lactate dehydrogenase
MNINTGDLTHDIREAELPKGSFGYAIGDWTARNLSTVKAGLRPVLTLANAAHTVLGTRLMTWVGKQIHQVLHLPLWTPAMPKPYRRGGVCPPCCPPVCPPCAHEGGQTPPLRVVYFPSCINQTMGLEKNSPEKQPLVDAMLSLLQKTGYEVIFPANMDNLCCGTIWESKGMMDIADRKSAELEAALYEASEGGKYPVLCDQSPCLYRMRHTITTMKLYEPVEFITAFLLDKLTFTQTDTPVAVHITCSMRKMGLDKQIIDLAKRCSTQVLVPEEVGCCGFAGDKGFTQPEVNAYALRKLRPQIAKAGITRGYSNSRTCEIGLTTNAGIPYRSIIYLINENTK